MPYFMAFAEVCFQFRVQKGVGIAEESYTHGEWAKVMDAGGILPTRWRNL
jgi:hypothetical protein